MFKGIVLLLLAMNGSEDENYAALENVLRKNMAFIFTRMEFFNDMNEIKNRLNSCRSCRLSRISTYII